MGEQARKEKTGKVGKVTLRLGLLARKVNQQLDGRLVAWSVSTEARLMVWLFPGLSAGTWVYLGPLDARYY